MASSLLLAKQKSDHLVTTLQQQIDELQQDKDRYESAIDDVSGDTADLAEEVMGNANNNNGIS